MTHSDPYFDYEMLKEEFDLTERIAVHFKYLSSFQDSVLHFIIKQKGVRPRHLIGIFTKILHEQSEKLSASIENKIL